MNDLESLSAIAGGFAVPVLGGAAALFLVHRFGRAGWMGVPVAALLSFCTMFATVGLPLFGFGLPLYRFWDLFPLLYGALLAAMMGWRLPYPDCVVALPAAPVFAYAVSFILETRGADNPTSFLIAAAAFGFAIGSLASATATLVRHRAKRAKSHR